jgi:2-dehydro-3-deoxyphosphooctonate aldolase (KDO 8-P synthase)
MHTFNIGRVVANNNNKIFLIAGPCQIESQDHAEFTAGTIKEICDELDIDLIYKSSFDKANRSSIGTQRGIGIDEGLKILNSIKHEFGIPILTDIHESYQAQIAADAGIDILQIPAFLCRQTDLLLAAGDTGCAVNVKKGQFLAPHDMKMLQQRSLLLVTKESCCVNEDTLMAITILWSICAVYLLWQILAIL